jgi:hypothetical protein
MLQARCLRHSAPGPAGIDIADTVIMSISTQAGRYAQRRLVRRLGKSIPYVGAAVALLTLGSAIRRKGWMGGSLDAALNAVPFVGGIKNAAEVVRGRDFIRDKRVAG